MLAAVLPVDIAHSLGRNCLVIRWDDHAQTELPIPYLRGWCPCAACQGHGDIVRFREFPASISASEIHEMGAYAIAIRFSDGHDAGIFSWAWLRRLGADAPPQGWKRGAYRDGRFFDPSGSGEPSGSVEPHDHHGDDAG